MAKRRNKIKKNDLRQRVTNANAGRRSPLTSRIVSNKMSSIKNLPLKPRKIHFKIHQEDLRQWRPVRNEFKTVKNSRVRYNHEVRQNPRGRVRPQNGTTVRSPKNVSVCVRRIQRRSALFKLRTIGKGKRVSPIRKITPKSKVRCR